MDVAILIVIKIILQTLVATKQAADINPLTQMALMALFMALMALFMALMALKFQKSLEPSDLLLAILFLALQFLIFSMSS